MTDTTTAIYAFGHYGTVSVDVVPNQLVDPRVRCLPPELIRVRHTDENQDVSFVLNPYDAIKLAEQLSELAEPACAEVRFPKEILDEAFRQIQAEVQAEKDKQ